MTRAAILVSGGGANLQALLDSYHFSEISELQICAVISSDPDAYALTRARTAGIETYVVERALFPNGASFCNALPGKLRDVDTDVVICAGFREKLNYPILHYYKNRVINVQPALFPAFCDAGGFDAITSLKATIAMGVRVTGATSYFMTEEDNGCGPIILQKPLLVLPEDNIATLQDRIMRTCEWPVLSETVRLYCEGRLRVENGRVIILPESILAANA